MIKIILVLIASILVILGVYTYTNKTTQRSSLIPTFSQKEKEIKETEKILVLVPELKEKKNEKINEKNSDNFLLNQDILDISGNDNKYQDKIPGEDLQNISIENIKNNSTLTKEEKENRIADKAYYDIITIQSPILQIDNKQMMKMIEDDKNLHLNK